MRTRLGKSLWFRTTFLCVVLILGLACPLQSLPGRQNPPNLVSDASSCVTPDHGGMYSYYGKADYLFPAAKVHNPSVYVYKDRRRLLVFEDDILIRDYPIGLGPCPVGDKQKRGDGRTPEGDFFVCKKNPRSKYSKSLELSYPLEKHALEGLLCGFLSYGDYRRIVAAQERKKRPPWTTSLGGGICIHGGGAHEDWTKGCVALYNFDMDELFEIVRVGTPVIILP